jgi:hypothetical protein
MRQTDVRNGSTASALTTILNVLKQETVMSQDIEDTPNF